MRLWRIMTLAGAVIIGLVLGLGSLWALTGPVGDGEKFGPWTTNRAIGERDQTPYSRARIAIYGIWGLPPSEVVYYSARVDDDGAAFDRRCTYTIEGGPLPTRWWSVALYRDGFYIANPANRYSWTQTEVAPDAAGRWRIQLTPIGAEPNALALGDTDGMFAVLLRLYQPDPGVAEARGQVPLPTIRKVSCGAAGG